MAVHTYRCFNVEALYRSIVVTRVLTPEGLRQHRETYVAAMRAYNTGEVAKRMRSWTAGLLG